MLSFQATMPGKNWGCNLQLELDFSWDFRQMHSYPSTNCSQSHVNETPSSKNTTAVNRLDSVLASMGRSLGLTRIQVYAPKHGFILSTT